MDGPIQNVCLCCGNNFVVWEWNDMHGLYLKLELVCTLYIGKYILYSSEFRWWKDLMQTLNTLYKHHTYYILGYILQYSLNSIQFIKLITAILVSIHETFDLLKVHVCWIYSRKSQPFAQYHEIKAN